MPMSLITGAIDFASARMMFSNPSGVLVKYSQAGLLQAGADVWGRQNVFDL